MSVTIRKGSKEPGDIESEEDIDIDVVQRGEEVQCDDVGKTRAAFHGAIRGSGYVQPRTYVFLAESVDVPQQAQIGGERYRVMRCRLPVRRA